MSTKPIPFLQQLYILSVAKNEEVYIHIEGEDGIGVNDFAQFKKQQKAGVSDSEQAEHYLSKGILVLSTKDLMMYMSHVNKVSVSPIYNYCLKLKNTKGQKFDSYKSHTQYLVDLLKTYESNKRKMAQMGFNPQDILVLLYLYDGKPKAARESYDKVYKEAPMASRSNIIAAYKKLALLGYIDVVGGNAWTKYVITALGTSTMNDIIKKFILP